jgi:hypothetical protein
VFFLKAISLIENYEDLVYQILIILMNQESIVINFSFLTMINWRFSDTFQKIIVLKKTLDKIKIKFNDLHAMKQI